MVHYTSYMNNLYDCVVIGAGPAGLSAAIYLGRFLRSVLVINKKTGRSPYGQINENYLGFPDGIPARELRKLGKKQAKKFGAEFIFDQVISAENTTKLRCYILHASF